MTLDNARTEFIQRDHSTALPDTVTVPAPVDWVVGIDLSLTGTGVAIVSDQGIRTHLITSKGKAGASLGSRADRLAALVAQIIELVPTLALVVIEQPAYSQTGGSHHDRSGLWWLIVNTIHPYNPVVEVGPGTLKKYVTGKGNAGKDEMLAAIIRRFPDANVSNNNIADAVGLAVMGARFLGYPQEASETVAMNSSMLVPSWPGVEA